jgi:hypothetical protein
LVRDEANKHIVDMFSKIKFDKEAINGFNILSEMVYRDRKDEQKEKRKLIDTQIKDLELEKKSIT